MSYFKTLSLSATRTDLPSELSPKIFRRHATLLHKLSTCFLELDESIQSLSTKKKTSFTRLNTQRDFNLNTLHSTPSLDFNSPDLLENSIRITQNILSWRQTLSPTSKSIDHFNQPLLNLLQVINEIVGEKMNEIQMGEDDVNNRHKDYLSRLQKEFTIPIVDTQNRTLNQIYDVLSDTLGLIEAKLHSFATLDSMAEEARKYDQLLLDFKAGHPLSSSAAGEFEAEGIAKLALGEDKDPDFYTHLQSFFKNELTHKNPFHSSSFATLIITALVREEWDRCIKGTLESLIKDVKQDSAFELGTLQKPGVAPSQLSLNTLSFQQYRFITFTHRFLNQVTTHLHDLTHTKSVLESLNAAIEATGKAEGEKIRHTVLLNILFLNGLLPQFSTDSETADPANDVLEAIQLIIENTVRGLPSHKDKFKNPTRRFADLLITDPLYHHFTERVFAPASFPVEGPSLIELLSKEETFSQAKTTPLFSSSRPFSTALSTLSVNLCTTEELCLSFYSPASNPMFFSRVVDEISRRSLNPEASFTTHFILEESIHLIKNLLSWIGREKRFPAGFDTIRESIPVMLTHAMTFLIRHHNTNAQATSYLINLFTCNNPATQPPAVDAFLKETSQMIEGGIDVLIGSIIPTFRAGSLNPDAYISATITAGTKAIADLEKTPAFYAGLETLIKTEAEHTVNQSASATPLIPSQMVFLETDAFVAQLLSRLVAPSLFAAILQQEKEWKALMREIKRHPGQTRPTPKLIEQFRNVIQTTFQALPEEFIRVMDATKKAIEGAAIPQENKAALLAQVPTTLFFVRGISYLFLKDPQCRLHFEMYSGDTLFVPFTLTSILNTLKNDKKNPTILS
jgi:hypothetical protein